jgi:hypothetical protein
MLQNNPAGRTIFPPIRKSGATSRLPRRTAMPIMGGQSILLKKMTGCSAAANQI